MAAILHTVESPGKRREILCGKIVTTTSGTIDTANSTLEGMTVVKAAGTGRYTLTVSKKYAQIDYIHANVEVSASTAAVTAKGVCAVSRSVSASNKTAVIQILIPPLSSVTAGIDSEVEDAAVIRVMVVARRGTL